MERVTRKILNYISDQEKILSDIEAIKDKVRANGSKH